MFQMCATVCIKYMHVSYDIDIIAKLLSTIMQVANPGVF